MSTTNLVNQKLFNHTGRKTATVSLGILKTEERDFHGFSGKKIHVLFDTGCGGCLVNGSFSVGLRSQATKKTSLRTKAGTFETSKKVKCCFFLPEFHERKLVEWPMYVEESNLQNNTYDIIIGRDLM